MTNGLSVPYHAVRNNLKMENVRRLLQKVAGLGNSSFSTLSWFRLGELSNTRCIVLFYSGRKYMLQMPR